ncbi:MAG: homoserine kinase type [Solirubrobacteraceae bacterium]|nr:homoserine kinase type [Solirubrobacteraceae bacterium]
MEGGEDNLNVVITSDAGKIVIRRYEVTPLSLVAVELDFVTFLSERGYPTPPPLTTPDGARLADMGKPVALFPFVEGRTPDRTTTSLAVQLGELLAWLHELARDWDDGRLPEIDRLGMVRRGAQREWPLAGGSEFQAELRAFLEARGEYLEATLPALPAGPIHHDLHRLNVIVRGRLVAAVLDFDELNRGPFAADPLRTFHYVAQENPAWRLPEPLARAALEAYESRRPLSTLEREVLPALFDLLSLVDAVDFLEDPPPDVTHVDDCYSLQVYRANRDYPFGAIGR